ncbi:hypothetical protein D3C73_1247530 [compost metagenome]
MLSLAVIGGQLRRFLQGGIAEGFAADHDMGTRNILRMQPCVVRRSQPVRHIFVLQVVFADIDVHAFRRSIDLKGRTGCFFLLFAFLAAVTQVTLINQLVADFLDVVKRGVGELLQQCLHIGDFFIGFDPLFFNDQQAVLVLVVFLEITLRVVRRGQQRVKRNGDFCLILIVVIDQSGLFVTFR